MDAKIIRDKLVGDEEDRAVSPVIGVVLMVAITVILAAVIAAFVMDMGDDMGESAPTASFDWEEDGDGEDPTVTHSGGDTLDADDISIIEVGGDDDDDLTDSDGWDNDEISAGDSQTLDDDVDEYSIVWESGSDSSTLDTHDFDE